MIPARKYLIHPQYIIISLVIGSITALFLGFTGAYIYSRVQQGIAPIQLPSLFYFNSLLIVASSLTLIYAKKRYEDDDTPMFKVAIWLTLLFTILFLIMQIKAWYQLYDANIGLASSTLASYMYLISGLHFLHLVAGIPFLAHFIYQAHKRMRDPVTVLMYFTDPDRKRVLQILNIYQAHKRMRDPVTVLMYFTDPDRKRVLQILNIYWHFLDGLWIYLICFFLINYLL